VIPVNNSEFHKKSWGGEDWLVNNDLYCCKILIVEEGKYCSYHYHKNKTEDFFIHSGNVLLELQTGEAPAEKESVYLCEGTSVHIPVGKAHRFTAVKGNALIVEASTHHEDGDSYRLEPSYSESPLAAMAGGKE
jgi:mannose-6-phosphate isomerase-like protein (cupin superfamily)